MKENHDRLRSSGAAHCSNSARSSKLLLEQQKAQRLVGSSSPADVALEFFAGNQYLRVRDLHDYKNLLPSYGGKSDKFPGLLPIDLDSLPDGVLNLSLIHI